MPTRRFSLVLAALLALSGCAALPRSEAVGANKYAPRPAASPVDIGADWNWLVSGDRAISPVQVFSMKGKTYLQMRPQQIVPAIVVAGVPVPFQISQPYLVIHGEPREIDLISSGYRAVVVRVGADQAPKIDNSIDRIRRAAIQ